MNEINKRFDIPVYLGIDAGGSTLRSTALNNTGKIVDKFREKRNMNFASCGKEGIVDAFSVLKSRFDNVRGLALSMAGIAGKDEYSQIECIVKELFPNLEIVELYPDAMGTLIANFDDSEGISVIAGTGSIVVAKNSENKLFRSGGWGYLLADEASGFWFVKETAIKYFEYRDNLADYYECFEVFEKNYDIPLRDFASVFYKGDKRNEIASMSKILLNYEDELIKSLIYKGANLLNKRIKNISELIYSGKNIEVILNGGMFSNEKFRKEFFKQFKEINKTLELKKSVDEVETRLAYRIFSKVK